MRNEWTNWDWLLAISLLRYTSILSSLSLSLFFYRYLVFLFACLFLFMLWCLRVAVVVIIFVIDHWRASNNRSWQKNFFFFFLLLLLLCSVSFPMQRVKHNKRKTKNINKKKRRTERSLGEDEREEAKSTHPLLRLSHCRCRIYVSKSLRKAFRPSVHRQGESPRSRRRNLP